MMLVSPHLQLPKASFVGSLSFLYGAIYQEPAKILVVSKSKLRPELCSCVTQDVRCKPPRATVDWNGTQTRCSPSMAVHCTEDRPNRAIPMAHPKAQSPWPVCKCRLSSFSHAILRPSPTLSPKFWNQVPELPMAKHEEGDLAAALASWLESYVALRKCSRNPSVVNHKCLAAVNT